MAKQSKQFKTFAVLTKYDPFQGKFVAVAAQGSIIDRANEVLDYHASKVEFQKWSDSQYKASGGKSYGNLRLQHDPKKPAGILTSPIQFDDASETIKIEGQVIDPVTKELMRLGALTGVSIGGAYKSKRLDPLSGATEYVPKISEISVVDRPCMPNATFSVVKTEDGTHTEMQKFVDEKTADELISKFYGEAEMSDATGKKLQKSLDALTKSVGEYFALAKKNQEFGVMVNENDEEDSTGDVVPDEREVPAPSPEEGGVAAVPTDEDGDFDDDKSGEEDAGTDCPAVPMSTAKAEKADFSVPNTEATMSNKEVTKLEKAHRSAIDHLQACSKAVADHNDDRCAMSHAQMKAVNDHLQNVHKALTGADMPSVPLETTKTDTAKVEEVLTKKDDTMTDEQIAKVVESALAKVLGREEVKPEKELSLEERIVKAVEAAIEPLRKLADPKQSRPRYTEQVSNPSVSAEQIAKSAVAATRGDRNAINEMFKDTADAMRNNMRRSN